LEYSRDFGFFGGRHERIQALFRYVGDYIGGDVPVLSKPPYARFAGYGLRFLPYIVFAVGNQPYGRRGSDG
jgi:hypothetical protein